MAQAGKNEAPPVDVVVNWQSEALIEEAPLAYYRPPYVGSSGWIGVELDQVSDDALDGHIREAWQLIVKKDRSRRVK